jgi:ABC-type bacteriocin/lantibiotic exporter with double-glycine peptidase domain
MNVVVQEDTTGCGIASVATLAGISYQQVRKKAMNLGISVTDSRLWSDTAFIRTLLKHFDVEARSKERPFQSWETLPSLALLAIKWNHNGKHAFWHWVIFWRGPEGPVVLDPKRSLQKNIRTDFGRIKPKWFLTITNCSDNKVANS